MLTGHAVPLLLLALSTGGPGLARDESAPPVRIDGIADAYHGTRVADPYCWLEDGFDPAVREWTARSTW